MLGLIYFMLSILIKITIIELNMLINYLTFSVNKKAQLTLNFSFTIYSFSSVQTKAPKLN